MAAMRLPLWLKILWTVWVAVWAPLCWKHYGAQNLLFFCDLGNFFIAATLWLESPLLVSWQATGLLLFQSLYTIDLLGAVVSGRHFIGGTEYMFDDGVPLFIRLLSLFHLVTPPLLLWAVWRLGYDPRGWKYQTLTTWIVAPINYFWRPEHDVNWARGPFFREQHLIPGWSYLMAYLILVPLLVYAPTHLALRWWTSRRTRSLAAID
ncbi:MAG TPA: hypothetical protein VN868_09980 [Terriglobales bacterium]|jgi:hypothetical protein|nr:hypothetical protein [Terriglobales bacterium]